MKAITVAMEVSSKGEVLKEAFTMVHESIESAQKFSKQLPKDFLKGSYKTVWQKPRIAKADAIKSRGNKMEFKTYLF
jgi:hypothetical protein